MSKASGPATSPPGSRATVLLLALAASPWRALCGLGWTLRGKRVRGWNLIYAAAADHPAYYDRWVAKAEPGIVRRFCDAHPPLSDHLSAACLIVGTDPDEATRTILEIRAVLGADMPILTTAAAPGAGVVALARDATLADALAALPSMPRWLLPLRAGTSPSRHFAALARRVADPAAQLIFWDEDTLRDGRRENPCIKPGWDPLLFDTYDGVTGACLIACSAALSAATGQVDAAGVAALTRRLLADELVVKRHVPFILTHRPDDAPFEPTHARSHTSLWPAGDVARWPSVSIVIPTRDRADLLRICVAGLQRLEYPGAVETIIVDNDSRDHDTLVLLDHLAGDRRTTILRHPGPFNFAAMNNRAAAAARGAILCFLNNDVEAIDAAWLTAMVRHAVLDRVGAVGARLLYPDRRVQHAGIAIGIGGAAGHVEKGAAYSDPRLASWHDASRIVSAVTAAALVVARAKFLAVDGMDATHFPVDFNDVDLCLRLGERGWTSVIAADAILIHHESESRGRVRNRTAEVRFQSELASLRERWGTADYEDPHYSPRFRKDAERCILAF